MFPKIAILVRCDFFSKKGGDTVQIQSYVDNSNLINYHILTYDQLKDLEPNEFCLFILTNIDSLSSYVRFVLWLDSKNRLDNVIILPIHHSFAFSRPLLFSCPYLALDSVYSREAKDNCFFHSSSKCFRVLFNFFSFEF